MRFSRQFVILSLFLLAGFIAYLRILNFWFISDDFSQIGKVAAGDLSVVWGKAHSGPVLAERSTTRNERTGR
jgi:hypothetical protein